MQLQLDRRDRRATFGRQKCENLRRLIRERNEEKLRVRRFRLIRMTFKEERGSVPTQAANPLRITNSRNSKPPPPHTHKDSASFQEPDRSAGFFSPSSLKAFESSGNKRALYSLGLMKRIPRQNPRPDDFLVSVLVKPQSSSALQSTKKKKWRPLQ